MDLSRVLKESSKTRQYCNGKLGVSEALSEAKWGKPNLVVGNADRDPPVHNSAESYGKEKPSKDIPIALARRFEFLVRSPRFLNPAFCQ
jgi:hypothetical protein